MSRVFAILCQCYFISVFASMAVGQSSVSVENDLNWAEENGKEVVPIPKEKFYGTSKSSHLLMLVKQRIVAKCFAVCEDNELQMDMEVTKSQKAELSELRRNALLRMKEINKPLTDLKREEFDQSVIDRQNEIGKEYAKEVNQFVADVRKVLVPEQDRELRIAIASDVYREFVLRDSEAEITLNLGWLEFVSHALDLPDEEGEKLRSELSEAWDSVKKVAMAEEARQTKKIMKSLPRDVLVSLESSIKASGK